MSKHSGPRFEVKPYVVAVVTSASGLLFGSGELSAQVGATPPIMVGTITTSTKKVKGVVHIELNFPFTVAGQTPNTDYDVKLEVTDPTGKKVVLSLTSIRIKTDGKGNASAFYKDHNVPVIAPSTNYAIVATLYTKGGKKLIATSIAAPFTTAAP